jgi:predicted transcriptional regulator
MSMTAPSQNGNGTRLTIELNETADKALKRLADELHTTKVDVIRRALSLLDKVESETKNSQRKLTIADSDDRILKELIFR